MSIAKVKVPEERIVNEGLEDDVHVTCSSHIIDSAKATGVFAGRYNCIAGHKVRIFCPIFGRAGQLIKLSFPS